MVMKMTYADLEKERVHALVKHGTCHKEKSGAWKKDMIIICPQTMRIF
ncbi:hypothetical protein OMP38_07720 [Cohnella ginsengisoli]|uniref:Uncharacterized protein n=1 Tax=Cohnella ginsengisoli TaxID=425004 RepID=A0A9X4QLN0_9BACL|nr:hypothetical protein [Cohnella ginsengisoli]MDG0790758.1 hypothetical protein [Cohnella ginsengisoli]